MYIPYILKSNPHSYYSFRGLKNQMRIRIAYRLDSRSWAGFWKNDRAAVRAVITIQYNNLLFYLLFVVLYNIKKAVPLQAWSGPKGSKKLRFPDFMTTAQVVVRLSALGTDRLYPQETLLVLISARGWVDPRATVRSEGFYVYEKSTDTSWDRTTDLPICSIAP